MLAFQTEAEPLVMDRDPSRQRAVMIRGCVVAALLAVVIGTQVPRVGQAFGFSPSGPSQSWKR